MEICTCYIIYNSISSRCEPKSPRTKITAITDLAARIYSLSVAKRAKSGNDMA